MVFLVKYTYTQDLVILKANLSANLSAKLQMSNAAGIVISLE